VSLSNAKAEGAKFTEADLSGANLQEAHLKGADFSNANLKEADLSKSRCSEAIGLTQGQLDDAFGDDDTELPPGLTIKFA